MTEKIGVGVITCERPDYFNNLLESIDKKVAGIDRIVVIDDGIKKTVHSHSKIDFVKHTDGRIGVGKGKNMAIRDLFDNDCDYIFIIEDDMLILDSTVFQQYIEASKVSNIQHFNYGPGSPFNRKQTIKNFDLHNRHLLEEETEPDPRIIIDYKNCKIALYKHVTGTCSFYTRKAIDAVGFIDENYKNAWEHVDHTYNIIKANLHPPFWWFADLANSHKLITPQKNAIGNSSTSKNTIEWMENVRINAGKYKNKHGHYPAQTPDTDINTVTSILKKIKTNG
jgi:GT2 family glycosyltransferase